MSLDEDDENFASFVENGSDEEYSSDAPLTIPTNREEMDPVAPYTTYRFFGLEVEFPQDRIPFSSQKSTMTAVAELLFWLLV